MEVREEQPSSHRLAKSMGVDARNMQVMKASFFMEEEAPSGLGMFLNCRLSKAKAKKKEWSIWTTSGKKPVIGGFRPGLEVIKFEFILRLKIKCNGWLLADMCPQARVTIAAKNDYYDSIDIAGSTIDTITIVDYHCNTIVMLLSETFMLVLRRKLRIWQDFSASVGTKLCIETRENFRILQKSTNFAVMHGRQQHIHPIAI